ncbi:unnamed protein product [Penicillium glandicola]
METPRNRKQRRAAAGPSSQTDEPEIAMAHPQRNDPTKNKPTVERTLYDIIAERQAGLHQKGGAIPASVEAQGIPRQSGGTRFVTVDASGQLVDTDGDISSHLSSNASQKNSKNSQKGTNGNTVKQSDSESEPDKPLPPFLDTILISMPLTTLHLTLGYLAAHQYAERIDLPKLFKESVTTAFPLLTFFVHLAHGHIISFKKRSSKNAKTETPFLLPLTSDKLTFSFLRRLLFPPTLQTLVFLPLAAVLGAHLVAITNGEPYYAVMKKAPAVGTMWVWCILELSFGPAVLGALGPLIWGVWWMGRFPSHLSRKKTLDTSSLHITMSEHDQDPLHYYPAVNATTLRHEIVETIFRVRRLRLIVIIPAQPGHAGSPLALAFIFIRPFLTDWDSHGIQWGLSVETHPGQGQAFIEIDLTTYPSSPAKERQRKVALPVYVLQSDAGARNWQF